MIDESTIRGQEGGKSGFGVWDGLSIKGERCVWRLAEVRGHAYGEKKKTFGFGVWGICHIYKSKRVLEKKGK